MLYVIDKNFKAVSRGENSVAHTNKGQFFFNTEDNPNKAVLLGIADKQKFKYPKNISLQKLHTLVVDGLSQLKLREVKMTANKEKVAEIIEEGRENDQSEDAILINIVNAGIGFKQAVKLFNAVMTEKGYSISPKKRKEEAETILGENKEIDYTDYNNVINMAEHLSKEIADTSFEQGVAAVRRFCKANDLPIGTKPKAAGGFPAKLRKWVLESDMPIDNEAFQSFMEENKKDEKQAAKLWPTVEFANNVFEKATA